MLHPPLPADLVLRSQGTVWQRLNSAQYPVVGEDVQGVAYQVAGRMTALAQQLYPTNDAACAQAHLVAGMLVDTSAA